MKAALLFATALVGVTGSLRADRLDALVKRSPFAPDKSATATTTQPIVPSRVEFGGYMVVDGNPLVSLCDTVTGQASWVGLKDSAAAYFVESLDPTLPSVSVRLNGAMTTLALRKPVEVSGAAASLAPGAPPSAATINDPGAANPGTAAAPEAESGPPKNRIPPQTLRIPKRVDDPA